MNLLEFACASNPRKRDPEAHPVFTRETTEGGSGLTVATLHCRGDAETQWAMEWSRDLQEWFSITVPNSVAPTPDGGRNVRFSAPNEGDGTRMFRLRVTTP